MPLRRKIKPLIEGLFLLKKIPSLIASQGSLQDKIEPAFKIRVNCGPRFF
jgi:hypothetical protein